MKIYGVIYKITNKINNKHYIGQTIVGVHKRWNDHIGQSKRLNTVLAKAIRKYGKENFEVTEIVNTFNREELNKAEISYIAEFNSLTPNGYNLTIGGEGASPTEETKQKISKAHLGMRHTKESRQLMSDSKKGKPSSFKNKNFTEESLIKLSLSHKGQVPVNKVSIGAFKDDVLVKSYDSIAAAKKDGFFQQNIHACLNGKFKQYKGYTWKRLSLKEVT